MFLKLFRLVNQLWFVTVESRRVFEALQISRKKAMVTPKKKGEMFKVYFNNIENSDMHIDFSIAHSAEDKWVLDVFKGKQVKKSMAIGIDALKSF